MYSSIFEEIKKYDKIVIARHIGVDPDALASQVALREAIRLTFPNKEVYAVGNSSSKFSYFPKLDRMPSELDGLLIIVDTPDKKRVDIPDLSGFAKTIKIDHHPWIETFCDIEYIDDTRVNVIYEVPLSEIVFDFFDKLKSCTKGYASLDYELTGYKTSKLQKMDILLNGSQTTTSIFAFSSAKRHIKSLASSVLNVTL